MTLLDGKTLSKTLKQELKIKTSELEAKYHVKPTMAIVLVGDNSASEIYVRNKIKAAAFVGIETKLIKKYNRKPHHFCIYIMVYGMYNNRNSYSIYINYF